MESSAPFHSVFCKVHTVRVHLRYVFLHMHFMQKHGPEAQEVNKPFVQVFHIFE